MAFLNGMQEKIIENYAGVKPINQSIINAVLFFFAYLRMEMIIQHPKAN